MKSDGGSEPGPATIRPDTVSCGGTRPPLCVAAAQCASIAGELAANVATHRRFMIEAAGAGVDLLAFPERSLTGYELAAAPGAGDWLVTARGGADGWSGATPPVGAGRLQAR